MHCERGECKVYGGNRKCVALATGGGQEWTVIEEVTSELTVLGECEIQQTRSTGRGNNLWKAPKGQELQGLECLECWVHLVERWSWKGQQLPLDEGRT